MSVFYEVDLWKEWVPSIPGVMGLHEATMLEDHSATKFMVTQIKPIRLQCTKKRHCFVREYDQNFFPMVGEFPIHLAACFSQ